MGNIILGIVSIVIAMVFGVLSLVAVYPQGRQWLADTSEKIIRPFVPSGRKSLLTSDQIAQKLQGKHGNYENTKFHFASYQTDFHGFIARELVASIKQILSNDNNSSPQETLVRVGIICGPMTFRTADWINKHRTSLFKKQDDFSKVVFVAMNRAAESDCFKYSANYLVSYFADIFPHSQAIAYTTNPYDKNKIDDHRKSIDILLCSAGSRDFSEQNYIDIWRNKMKGFSNQELIAPRNCIGDFCLTPIDINGNSIFEPALSREIEDILDPYPIFKHLGDIKNNKTRPIIIFPVSDFSDKERTKRNGGQEPKTTGKEIITKTVLKTGVIDTCILSRNLAENLGMSIGEYLLEKVSAPLKDSGKLRVCKAVDLRSNSEQSILVYDPNGRIEQPYYGIDPTLSLPAHPYSEIPEIIISELTDESTQYDWQNDTGNFNFDVYGNKYKFFVEKNVRRPGQWSLVTFQMMKKCVELLNTSENQSQHLKIWDMGCGCGIIGILTTAVVQNKINRLLFSDIDPQAIDCTERNMKQLLPRNPSFTVQKGSLFTACNLGEKFHVIALNPPFLPLLRSKDTSLDSGGKKGYEIAEEYCANLYEHLEVGGWGILAIADYVDDGRVLNILTSRFGEENVQLHERLILYPYEPNKPIPPAYEITERNKIERICDYHFESIYLGEKRFLVFEMRHYLANRKN